MVGEPDLAEALDTLLVFASCTDEPARLFPNLTRAGADLGEAASMARLELGSDLDE
jgi:hypothetical protein